MLTSSFISMTTKILKEYFAKYWHEEDKINLAINLPQKKKFNQIKYVFKKGDLISW